MGVAAAVLQILFGFFRAGILGEFFPIAAVHGMLAAIGVIIIIKQIPVALGVINPRRAGRPVASHSKCSERFRTTSPRPIPAIAAIGLVSMLIMFLWPVIGKKTRTTQDDPVPHDRACWSRFRWACGFDLLHEHSYTLQGHEYQLSEQYLVNMPDACLACLMTSRTPTFRL